MNQAESIAKFEDTLKRVSNMFESMDEEMLNAPLRDWSPRGIVSHWIGWNGYIKTGCQEVQQGETPFYEENAGENCCNVNAAFVKQFADTPKEELISQLQDSGKALMDYVATVPVENYTKDFGVRYEDEVVTVDTMITETIEDYEHHEQQILEWAKDQS